MVDVEFVGAWNVASPSRAARAAHVALRRLDELILIIGQTQDSDWDSMDVEIKASNHFYESFSIASSSSQDLATEARSTYGIDISRPENGCLLTCEGGLGLEGEILKKEHYPPNRTTGVH